MAEETRLILIDSLELQSRIGITAEERYKPQRLTVNLTIEPSRQEVDLGDDLANTVDYFAVCQAVKTTAIQGERQLVETLAEEISRTILSGFPVYSVVVELRKYILPDTAFVAIRIRRPL